MEAVSLEIMATGLPNACGRCKDSGRLSHIHIIKSHTGHTFTCAILSFSSTKDSV